MQEALSLLAGRGYDDRAIDGLPGSAQALVSEENFWQHQRKGLALFVTADETFHYRLPVAPEELTWSRTVFT